MKCRLCRQPYGAQVDGHHDHLGKVALAEWRRLAGRATKDGDGYVAALIGSTSFQRLLRFRGKVKCCQACNGLEVAWKRGSNQVHGFLPREFSLTPKEIARIRRHAISNRAPHTGVLVRAVWERRCRGHARCVVAIEQMVRLRHSEVKERRRT